ncbi:MAG: ABC-2 transporter permease [Alistipes sp.]|nr:ABC-2 transporter permease [Alistipes sp.]
MKGLLIKDLCLMAMQKRFFIVVLAMGILLTFSGQDILFLTGYLTMVFGIFAGSTISYDEMNHGMAFLLTLPVDRKQYVRSKYLFMLFLVAVSLVVSFLLGFAGSVTGKITVDLTETLAAGIMTAAAIMALIGVFLMLILKYGAEKARIVTALLFGAGIFCAWAFKAIGEKADGKLFIHFNPGNWSNEAAALIFCGACVLVTLISYAFSVRIMEKRDF